ncbi:MAG: RsmB/NOP family class I SAM-dependent RNA methyltransferase, partial [bacterium]
MMANSFESFSRYRPFIDDWPAFVEMSQTPLPTCVWSHPLRIAERELAARLRQQGLTFDPVTWYDGAYLLPSDVKFGNSLEYSVGLCHVQEEVALIPVVLLDPKPAERVLDLCAAPGNKTAQMALRMQLSGTVIANDVTGNRMRAMRRVISRLGLINVSTTLHNAATYPRQDVLFDRVLADVPCSCEGTSRKHPGVIAESGRERSLRLARLQTAILRRALQLCKIGGRVVYSTCTYAPEENEMVVQAALDSLQPKIRAFIKPGNLQGFRFSPGVEKWRDQVFRKDMHNALRIYPHQNNTGGFFIAVIEKREDAGQQVSKSRIKCDVQQSVQSLRFFKEEECLPWFEYLDDRFGIPVEIFSGLKVFRTNKKSIGIINDDHEPIVHPTPHFIGVPFFRTNMKYPKLTTAAALIFGQKARRNVLELGEREVEVFLSSENISVAAGLDHGIDEGYVIAKFPKHTLGVGLLLQKPEGNILRSLYPKRWHVS